VIGLRDASRQRFYGFSRLCHVLAYVLVVTSSLWLLVSSISNLILVLMIGMALVAVAESRLVPPVQSTDIEATPTTTTTRRGLSRAAILTLLKPYFWPDATESSAAYMNRIRAILTWLCVVLSKVANLLSPILLGWASTALSRQEYMDCIAYSIYYAIVGFFGSTFKECQSLIYLKVAQAAFVQLSETAFWHLHSLSLDWHLRKKLGEVLRSMDRGIAACDTLMKYLFLWLVPALVECVVVCGIFATYFHYWPMALSVAAYVWIYILWTILVTVWRKKFRKAVVKSDNEWHDRCTDSLINFETVKYFTAETYEMKRYV
jgi:ABC-type multidrug transport system fused ATPase/permease subunit